MKSAEPSPISCQENFNRGKYFMHCRATGHVNCVDYLYVTTELFSVQ